jgi:hypothetical protein
MRRRLDICLAMFTYFGQRFPLTRTLELALTAAAQRGTTMVTAVDGKNVYTFTRGDDGDVVIGGEKFTLNVNWSQLSTVGNFSIDAPQVDMDALLCADIQVFTDAGELFAGPTARAPFVPSLVFTVKSQ